MTVNVPTGLDIERVVIITADCLRWDYHEPYKELYPPGVWYRGTAQATFTPASHGSMFSGLYPPSNGVYDFGQTLEKDNIFSNTNAVSTSGITEDGVIDVAGVKNNVTGFHYFEREYDKDKVTELLGEHDLAFLHDWAIHACGPQHAEEVEWDSKPIVEGEPEKSKQAYDHHIQLSLGDHKQFLTLLRENDLYDDTLFIIWGDHGQAFGEPPTNNWVHSGLPTEYEARVPIAFCHSDMESRKVDAETNARSIDIVPTLRSLFRDAGLVFEPFKHELPGVDLTRHEGSLLAYSIASHPASRGGNISDGVSSPDRWYMNGDYERLWGGADGLMFDIEYNEKEMGPFRQYRKDVRSNSLGKQESNKPRETMKKLGYL